MSELTDNGLTASETVAENFAARLQGHVQNIADAQDQLASARFAARSDGFSMKLIDKAVADLRAS